MRDQGGDGAPGAGGHGRSDGASAIARVGEELAQLGVAEPARSELARRLAPMIRGLSGDAYAAALAGVALAHAVHREQHDTLRRSLRDLGEIQRLLGSFSEELCRLDEALRMLSRDVRAKRAGAATTRSRQLH